MDEATAIPATLSNRLRQALDRAIRLAGRVAAAEDALEHQAREAASALYHAASAILMRWEASQPGTDARRALHARLMLEHRLGAEDPLALDEAEWEREAAELLLSGRSVPLAEVAALLA